jgi:TonB family protein
MRKDFFFSLFGHLGIFFLFTIITTANRKNVPKPYPLVYRVNLVSLATEEPKSGVAVVNQPAKKTEPIKKPVEKPKPKTQAKTTSQVKTRAGLGARVEGFEYSYYLNVVLSRISENWINPYQSSNYLLKCMIYFIIHKDGTISDAKIETSSKNNIYDQSCLRAVIATMRLPPLPEEFKPNELKLHLEFEYKP